MVYELTRREFLGTTAGFYLAHTTLTSSLIAEQKEETVTAEQKRRLDKLEYLLNPPKKESIQFEGGAKFKLDEDYFILSTDKNTPIQQSKLFKIILYDPKKHYDGTIRNSAGNNIHILSRDYLNDKKTREKLKKAAKNDKLPLMYPSWMDEKEIPYILLGTIFLEPKSPEKKDSILKFAKKNRLEILKEKPPHMEFNLTNDSEFRDHFTAVRAFLKEGNIKWCLPHSGTTFPAMPRR